MSQVNLNLVEKDEGFEAFVEHGKLWTELVIGKIGTRYVATIAYFQRLDYLSPLQQVLLGKPSRFPANSSGVYVELWQGKNGIEMTVHSPNTHDDGKTTAKATVSKKQLRKLENALGRNLEEL